MSTLARVAIAFAVIGTFVAVVLMLFLWCAYALSHPQLPLYLHPVVCIGVVGLIVMFVLTFKALPGPPLKP